MESPIIDVVIPNRNKAPFLKATLNSLVAQTERRWRAVVIDGESTDGSWDILQAAAAQDSRIRVKSARPASATGQSIYRSWNQGLWQVRAPYYAILTSDDLWQPEWLARAVTGLESHASAIAAAARAIEISETGKVAGPTAPCQQLEESFGLKGGGMSLLAAKACLLRALLFGPIFTTIHSLVFRRKVLEEGVIFSEDLGYIADVEYYLHTCLLGDILYDLDSQALFRMYPAQASSEAQGQSITRLWSKVILRNRRFVAAKLGIPLSEMCRVTNEILARHNFIMTKPNWQTIKRSKALAGFRMLKAFASAPRLGLKYTACRGNKHHFLEGNAQEVARQLSLKYAV